MDIMNIWTVDFPDVGIGIITNLVPDPNGFIINVDDRFISREHMQPFPQGPQSYEIRVGSLNNYTGALLQYQKNKIAHEFGHFFFMTNLFATALNPSIMADDSRGKVLPSDLQQMVEFCKSRS